MDVLACLAATRFGKEWTVSGKGPLVYEFTTYRYFGHSVSDPGTTYRTRADVQTVRGAQDPIVNLAIKLTDLKVFTNTELASIQARAKDEVEKSVVEAEQSPVPEPTGAILFEDTYVRGSGPQFLRGRTVDELHYFGP